MGKWKRTGMIVLFTVIFLFLPGNGVLAQQTEIRIKVAVPLMNDSGFVTYEDGTFSGYYIDYLTEIARYTGWEYEYMPIESYEELDTVCRSGDFDLMTGIVYSDEYEDAYFEYPKNSVGAKRYVFAVPKDSGIVPDEEYAFLRGMKIGVSGESGTNELEERFRDFCFRYGIECASDAEGEFLRGVNFIHLDPAEWREKIEAGEVDGILASDAFCLSKDMYAAVNFGLDQIYFATPNGRTGLTETLDDALKKIHNFNPEYNEALYDKYFSAMYKRSVAFSEEEREYLKDVHIWKVSLPESYAPYAYINDDREPAGLAVQVFNKITEQTDGQMQFQYMFYNSVADAEKAVVDGNCDIAGVSEYSLQRKQSAGVKKSASFYEDSYTYYKNSLIPPDADGWTAVMPNMGNGELLYQFQIKDPVVNSVTAEKCLEQVEQERGTYTILLSHVGNYYKSYYGYQNLADYKMADGEALVCFAYKADIDPMASSIMDECLNGVDPKELDEYVTRISLFEHKEHNMQEYIKENSAFFALLLVGVLLIICTLLAVILVNAKRDSKRIHDLLYQDDITDGISYKRFIEEAGRICMQDGKRLMLYMNISSFKYINDVFGYGKGNEVLREVERFFSSSIPQALWARVYADRFVALLPYERLDEVKALLQSRLDEFDRMSRKKFPAFNIWVKIGAYPMEKNDAIQKSVNLANYAVDEIQKVSDSKCIFYDEDMHQHVLMQKDVERDMWEALERREFEAFYQPKYNILTKELIGAEALIRWRHPEKGLLPPGIFIPIFEKNHFILQADFYIFECVCGFMQRLMEHGIHLFPISSNFSRLHLKQPDFVEKLARISEKYGIPPEFLEIEITETVAVEDFDELLGAVKEMKEKGFHVSIDDFGSGHSSIQLLYKLPIDVLKLDKTFVDHEDASDFEMELMDDIISVSLKNGIKIICEGVETCEQEEFVRSHNCIYVQGFLYSRPLPGEQFFELLSEG